MHRVHDRLYHALKTGIITFPGAHDVHTPQALVEEMLDQVPLNGEILVMFNIEFVISLVYNYKVSPARITLLSDHLSKTQFCDRLGVGCITDLDTSMKFDVVIGNPPFQAGKNNNFYQEFVKTAFDLSNDIVAMITPSNWTSFADSNSTFLRSIKDNGLVTYKFLGTSAFSEQIITVYFVCSKSRAGSDVTVITEEDSSSVRRDDLVYFPSKTTKSLSVVNAIKNLGLPGLVATKGSLDRNKAISDPNGVKCIFSAGKKNDDYDWDFVSARHLSDNTVVGHNQHKVVVSRVTSLGKLGELKYASPDYVIAQGAYYFTVTDSDQANNLISYLNSKIIRLIIRELKGAVCSNSQNIFKFIPAVDLTKSWSDSDLYHQFKLTQQEIDYIESYSSQ